VPYRVSAPHDRRGDPISARAAVGFVAVSSKKAEAESEMRVLFCIFFALGAAGGPPPTFGAEKTETSHLVFVTEYVRELAAIEAIRAAAEQELEQGAKDAVFTNAVYTSTRMQLELKTQISRLRGMRLNAPFEKVIADLTGLYQRKIELYQMLGDIGGAFIAGPKPGVDFGKMAAAMPQIRATLDTIDQSIFEATPLIFATLIDKKADSENHVSHLIITKAERERLLSTITNDFGSKLDQKNQNFTVSAASVLKAYLLKDFKSSDDAWE
jgi:hypothetical protein